MADISVGWEVEGVMSPEESVQSMLEVLDASSIKDTGKFLTWQGKVRLEEAGRLPIVAEKSRNIHGKVRTNLQKTAPLYLSEWWLSLIVRPTLRLVL